MENFEVTVNGERFRVRTSTPGQAAKEAIEAHLHDRKKFVGVLTLTLTVSKAPRVQKVE